MSRIITVTSPPDGGVHLRPSLPDGSVNVNGKPLDSLSRNDQLVWLKTSPDGLWHYGRLFYLASGLFPERLGTEGWVWAKETSLSAEYPPPPPFPKPPRVPRWLAWFITGGGVLIAAIVYWLFGGK